MRADHALQEGDIEGECGVCWTPQPRAKSDGSGAGNEAQAAHQEGGGNGLPEPIGSSTKGSGPWVGGGLAGVWRARAPHQSQPG